jgi:hypothetical protein
VKDLAPGERIYGALSFQAPPAEVGNELTIKYYTVGPPDGEFATIKILDEDTATFDVAARFRVWVKSITIRDTASHHEDEVVMSFAGQADSQQWQDSKHLGSHNNGTFSPGSLRSVGPVTLMPESDSLLGVSYVIANKGHSSDEDTAKKILEALSKVSSAVATVVMTAYFPSLGAAWGGISDAVDALHNLILDELFKDCDTVVAFDGRTFSAKELFDITYDPNYAQMFYPQAPVRYQKKYGVKIGTGTGLDSLGGGCRDSDYAVQLQIERSRGPDDVPSVYTDNGIRVAPGQIVQISYTTAPPGLESEPLWQWDVEGPGKVDTNGFYQAPVDTEYLNYPDWKFAIVSGRGLVTMTTKDGGIEQQYTYERYSGFTIMLLD